MLKSRWFKIRPKESDLRKMDRKTYYTAMSWFRNCERLLAKEMENK